MEKYKEEQNMTGVMEFILLGFPGSQSSQMSMFISFLTMYILTVCGNVAIVILVTTNYHFHTPMYFFLCNLSFLEIWYTTTSVPKLLVILLGSTRSISFAGCIVQLYFIYSFGCTEQLLLSVMAYDRYLAICYPLHYRTIMVLSLSRKLALGCWLVGFFVVSVPTYLITTLSFCGTNVINNFYCNIDSWIVLSCTDTHVIEMTTFVIALIIVVGSCAITIFSYVCIVYTILHIPTTKGQQKAFSTCSSHFTLLLMWYGSTIFLFVKSSKHIISEVNKTVNVICLIMVPLLNPFVYTLRNKEVKRALRQSMLYFGRKMCVK